jgi:hypothetical protein
VRTSSTKIQCSSFASGPRLGLVVPTEGVTCCSHGIDRIGLGAPSTMGPLGSVEFDDPLARFDQEPSQPGPVAAGAFDGPGPQARVALGQIEEGEVAVGIGWDGEFADGCSRSRHHDGFRVGVFVGVDADDDFDVICQHGHALLLCRGDVSDPIRVETAGLWDTLSSN